MRYPNLRYGNPAEMAYYAAGLDIKRLARVLRRSERSVKDWLDGKARVPWWVPEILRLQAMERERALYQMTGRKIATRLGLVQEAQIFYPKRELLPLPAWDRSQDAPADPYPEMYTLKTRAD